MRQTICISLAILLIVGVGATAFSAGQPDTPKKSNYRFERIKAFEDQREVGAMRDEQGVVRQLLHLQRPFSAEQAGLDEPSPRQLADAYVRRTHELFSLKDSWVDELRTFEAPRLSDDGTEIQFFKEKKLGGATVVSYIQTHMGLPVWQGGIAVTVLSNPVRITTATNAAHLGIEVEKPGDDAKFSTTEITPQSLASTLDLGKEFADTPPKINGSRLLIYQYASNQRIDPESKANGERTGLEAAPATLPLPPVPDEIENGEYRIVTEVLFTLPVAGVRLNWRVFVDVQTGAVLYLRALVAHVTGMVFLQDPITATGNTANTPSAPVTTLDSLRTTVTLLGLDPPAGNPQTQRLSGEFVRIEDISAPVHDGPQQGPPFQFHYSANTNEFAAANAYHHCDALFRLVQSMGIDVRNYFDETRFPVRVDHRATIGSFCPGGVCRNASAPGNTAGTGSDGFRFALADAGTTVGIAAAWRVVLHEFGHALLWDSVHSPNFGFAHSAGDSLAVILNDPGSQAPDRFASFPWVNLTTRRHDRGVASGWGWGGTQDIGGYSSEQILSTTLFRAYRSIGGDANNVSTQQLASRYSANLIVRGIGLLAADPVTPTPVPDIFEAAIMNADMGANSIEGLPGGAVHKVIRWAFEKQGLHRAPGAPDTSEGSPPEVDVYINDSRDGEYAYLENFWQTADIWNRLAADNGPSHQTPVTGQKNFLYVRVKNRGASAANNVTVRMYHCLPGAGLRWPNDWQSTDTPALPASGHPPHYSSTQWRGHCGTIRMDA